MGGERSGALGSTHTPNHYQSQPTGQLSRMGRKLGRHSPRVPASLELDQFPLFLFVPSLDLCQSHPEVQLQRIHVLQGRLHSKHLQGWEKVFGVDSTWEHKGRCESLCFQTQNLNGSR